MNAKNILIIILAALLVYFGLKIKVKEKEISALSSANMTLEADIKRQFDFKGRALVYRRRTAEGGVQAVNYYIPPEGSAEIRQTETDGIIVDIKNKGFTFKPFTGAFVNSDGIFDIAVGARLFYWGRYGLGAAYAKEAGPVAVLDRRADDLLPFLSNCSFMFYAGRKSFGLGAAIYF